MRVKEAPPLLPWVVAIWITWIVAAVGKVASAESAFLFTQATYNGSILENTFGKKYIHTHRRMGIHLAGRFASLDVEYAIVDGDEHNIFKAETVTVEDFCFLRIRTRTDGFGRLNRELNPMFYLKIKATGFSPARQTVQETFTDVVIEVKDENEFNPLFSTPKSNVSIREDTKLHTSIAQVEASDADIGRNGQVYFSFKQATLVFAIHPTTGVVTLSRPVPYDRRREFKLNVLARDRGITPSGRSSSNSQSELTITILPVNYHAPSIRVHNHQTLVEHGSLDSVFAVLTITDPDHDDNGKIGSVDIINDQRNVFGLEHQSTNGMFNILVKKPVDRETMPADYNITVIASDQGSPPKTATVTIPIRVQDVNDNEPIFEQSVYNVTVSEVVLPHTPVVLVKAHDKDLGSNGEVRYSIVDGNDRDLFHTDPTSGLIKTAAHLDSELSRQVTLVLQAQDQATSGTRHTGQCRVIINIEDYNDNTPVFTMDSYSVMVRENLAKGSRVTRVVARDDDSGDNGKLSYSIINDNNVPFDIDAFTGELTTTAVLDYETMRRKYELHIRVADWGSPFKREQDMILTIHVEDLNDNSPEFEEISCSGYLSRQSPLNMDVVKLTALDFDSGNTITYSITDGNGDDCFSIVPTSGKVTVNCDMSGYRDGTRTLTVVASDGQHVSIPVTITLTLVNNKQNQHLAHDNKRIRCGRRDVMKRFEAQTQASHEANVRLETLSVVTGNTKANTPPEVDRAFSTYAEIPESVKVGTEVLDFGRYVSDPDPGYNGQLTYVISGDEDSQSAFKLDSFTGKLLVMSELDNEKKSVYSMTLMASDLGEAPQSVSVEVKIVIKDENDNAPLFEKPVYDVKVSEDADVNSVLLKVTATDLDTGNNARVRYSIRSDDRDFNIDSDQGTITVRSKLNREERSNQELVIQAEDSGATTRLTSTAVVNITITDINDNDPAFPSDVYTVRVREDLPVGAVITTLTAHDPDEGANGQVSYSFSEGLPPNFEIDEQTGSVRIRRQLDYETTQVHNLTGLAQDSGQPSRSGTCKVIVEVMDVDENAYAPEFPDFLARASVAEGSPIGKYVMRVQAQDMDNPAFGAGQITYSLQGGSGLGRFTMDSVGTIRTSQVLDRETMPHYWLTVVAQDMALVPKFARLEVLVTVDDVNDNIPQSLEPAYYASVQENLDGAIQEIVRIQASDGDYDGSQQLSYTITGGNSGGFFQIDEDSGVISTTSKSLDREEEDEHALEVTISDEGKPLQSSETRVVIKVVDQNDNRPVFLKRNQEISVFATNFSGEDIFIYRAVAFDKDEGRNGEIKYILRNPKKTPTIRVDSATGKIFSSATLVGGQSIELQIKAVDGGETPRRSSMRLFITVTPREAVVLGNSPPRFLYRVFEETIPESDLPGEGLIVLLEAEDADNDRMQFAIIDGNDNDAFTIHPDHGSVFLARRVDKEVKPSYNLTVQVTDGISVDTASLLVNIFDTNDHEPVFSQHLYVANISESAGLGTPVLRVSATDQDSGDWLLYTIESTASTSSKDKFRIGAKNGVIVVSGALDREDLSRHLLTVMVRDKGVLSKRSYARVQINLLDHNDHEPRFLTQMPTGRVFETAAVGTSVLRVEAFDQDKGENGRVVYSIVSGNADNTFSIDRDSGIISVAKPLVRGLHPHFNLRVMASDCGQPSHSSRVSLTIDVTVSSNSPPYFAQTNYVVDMAENRPPGTVVVGVVADCLSTVTYKIGGGDPNGFFTINPNSGVISTTRPVDFEQVQYFNLTITASNIVSAESAVSVLVHILDVNDNAPEFSSSTFTGSVSEAALRGSMVLTEDGTTGTPLVIRASDRDSGLNARLFYEIADSDAQQYFAIDPNTGAIRILASLDYETTKEYSFSVQVHDKGDPELQAYSTASVIINVIDVNDCPPRFTQNTYDTLLLLPTYPQVRLLTVTAEDLDSDAANDKPLLYSLASGNEEGVFSLDEVTGVLTVKNDKPKARSYHLSVAVTDGKHTMTARIVVSVQQAGESTIKFTQESYFASIPENKPTATQLVIIQPISLDRGRHVTFTLLNNHDYFSIGYTSGVLSTTGLEFDREGKDSYTVVVKVDDAAEKELSAHVVVVVNVTDENDNLPMFVNLPYHCTVSGEAKQGNVIHKVQAIDPDLGENGRVNYRLANNLEDRFAINTYTQEIIVKHLKREDRNKELVLKVIAQDRGSPPLTAVASVHIHVTDSTSPLFEKHVYSGRVAESAAPHTAILPVQAVSPHGQKLLYSISRGDKYNDFALDFNIDMETRGPCYLSVIGPLDYEVKKQHQLVIRATDIFTGSYAETQVNVEVEDVNDNAPVFTSMRYAHMMPESAALGSHVLQVRANDSDNGANALVHYQLAPALPGNEDVEHFQVDTETGEITLRKGLDHETQPEFSFLVVARDGGMPAHSATATVMVKVLDLNDNAPMFTQPSYDCYISDPASRGQLVFKVIAFDPDETDTAKLTYSIVGGDEHSTFSIDPVIGTVSLSSQRQPKLDPAYTLNISVSDGVFTSFTRLAVGVKNANLHTPKFISDQFTIDVTEGSEFGESQIIIRALAVDQDRGNYGMMTYSIMNDEMREVFKIDADTGDITANRALDREEKAQYSFTVSARDNGGRTGYGKVLIRVRDINDNDPQFVMREFHAVVPYDASIGTTVLKIEASDADEGSNANLLFNIHEDITSVSELFNLDMKSGDLMTKASLKPYENKVYQFFVRVADQGNPPRESHAPVEILVLGKDDEPPRFRQRERVFSVNENEQVGTIIATIRARGKPGIIHSIVPGFNNATNQPPTFAMNSHGQVQLRRRLDREMTPEYHLNVRAETDGSPPLVDYMKIIVQVRDVNDNLPKFTCSPFEVTVPENIPTQHSIIQVQATDADREVLPLRYAINPAMEELSSVFAVNPDSGWVTLLTPLDRETRSYYNLSVVVWDTPDRLGRKSDKSLTATTSVLISITDVNDNAPTFQRGGSVPGYATAVNEGALSGTVLLQLQTEDKDLGANADVTYYITEGDHLDQFEVHNTGELFVNRPLDREKIARYRLRIAATDGVHVTYATVTVDVLDDNDNAPIFEQPEYKSTQDEDVAVGTAVLRVKATDADDPGTVHSKIKYSLQGANADMFDIGTTSGAIHVAKALDRETLPKLIFIAVAQDGGGLSATASITVSLKDVNDNIPVFPEGSLRETYNIKEDAELHTLLTRVAAIDADLGINSHVRYGLTQTAEKVFDIDPDSGIISLISHLDREKNPHYDLTVTAYNVIAPELVSRATVRVDILDVNDNPPEFERSSYQAAVRESAEVGTFVTRVKATSLDIGINADITYSLVAGNEQGKFKIDPKKGKVTVSEPLDHELSPEFFLTVLATDQGSPPLTASTVLSVNVTDVNDNPPRFSQEAYTLHVSEGASVGSEIFKVMATDNDSPPNAKITYSIIDGDNTKRFSIDPNQGILQIKAPLDREKTASYSLVIQAQDSGVQVLYGSAVVSVLVDDANDNPPRFSQPVYRGLVQEGRRTGIEILSVSVTDADLPENGRPFHLEIVQGNQNGEFHIDNTGLISTAGKLSKHVKDVYNLTVRAYDSGEPPLSSDAVVEISVVNDSLHPPKVQKMSVTIRSCAENFFGGVIGQLKAHDLDPYDKLVFTIVSPNSHLFDIHRFDGRLIALTSLDVGHYVVNASVSDGKFTSYARVDVDAVCTSKETLANAVTVQFESLSVEQFYANFKDDFRRVIKRELGVRTSDVEIINVQPSAESMEGMDHVLPANKVGPKLTRSDSHRAKRSTQAANTNKRGQNTNLDVLFAVRKSTNNYFPRQTLERKVKQVQGRIENKLGVAVVGVFSDTCREDSCKVGSCVTKVDFDESTLVPVQVKGAYFVSAQHRYIQQCVCLEGQCAQQVCGNTTCTANTVCRQNAFRDFVCQCPEGRTGHNCQDVVPLCSGNSCPIERPMTFAGKSYAKWRLRHSTKKRFSLRLRVRTRQTSAVLMYAKGKVDYSILQIERGSLVYKFDCGSGEGHVRIPVALSDGQWHTIMLERNGREAELSLDEAYTVLGVAPGVHAILNVESEELFFGAEVDVFPNGYRDIGHGFEGCMEDIRVFNIPLPFKGNNYIAHALDFEKVQFHCQDYPAASIIAGDACSSNPCLNGGQCKKSGVNGYVCICPGEFRGEQCELNPDPCQQNPCLAGGRCEKESESPNSFLCHCHGTLLGSRCSYGSFCLPNPCLHNGICVEGPNAPLCDCQPGYEGLYCEKTVDLCDPSPCHHGGTCHTMVDGSYFCNCTAEFTGKNCDLTYLVPGRITSSSPATLYWILGAVAIILFIVLVIVLCLLYYRRHRNRREKQQTKRQRRAPTGLPEGVAGTQGLLSGSRCGGSGGVHLDDDNVSCGGGGGDGLGGSSKGEKMHCKLSNPDLTEAIPSLPSKPPPVPTRPTSYTPSTHDSFNALNNLDGVRDYGSAADELESSGTGPRGHIPDFYQYVEGYRNPLHSNSAHPMLRATPPPPRSHANSESDSIQKQPWEFEYPNILENYMEGDKKRHNKLACKQMPGLHSPHQSPGPSLSRRVHIPTQVTDAASVSSLPVSESEDDLNGYHWDTSDWAPGPSMPNISEIPINEILDSPSSSQPSDDCNANARADPFDDNITTRGIYNMSIGDDHSPLLSSDEQNQNQDVVVRGHIYRLDDDDDDEEENVISRLEMDDYFDDSEYVGDSEYAENEPYDPDDLPPSYAEHPRYEQFLQNLDDSYEMPEALTHRQPLHYLPDHFSASHQELAIDPLTEDEDEREIRERIEAAGAPEAPAYPFYGDGAATMVSSDMAYQFTDEDDERHPRLLPPKEFMTPGYNMTDSFGTDKGQPSNRTSFIDDLSLSMGGFTSNASLSDISGLCEIEDSEINASDTDDENTPCLASGLEQTQL